MKKSILLIAASILLSLSLSAKEPSYNPNRSFYPSTQKTLTLSSSSSYSYEEAMNKFSRTKPEGYVIESISYYKVKDRFVVCVKLRKN